eukprot:TRINITY_DN31497_c0_g1_i3.p2 TRINITY_DN31497_c0_g1~~TRINITY_DN31497_c0_g1_i3.p2  ORF type:complete len:135 (-),score=4.58 TRINITY_DN31497_c0_g1_i3:237-641(-)
MLQLVTTYIYKIATYVVTSTCFQYLNNLSFFDKQFFSFSKETFFKKYFAKYLQQFVVFNFDFFVFKWELCAQKFISSKQKFWLIYSYYILGAQNIVQFIVATRIIFFNLILLNINSDPQELHYSLFLTMFIIIG